MCFGGEANAAESYTQAAQIQSNATQAGINTLQSMYGQARADVAPWRESGSSAANYLASLYSIPGYGSGTGEELSTALQKWPGLEFILGQGTAALDRSAASKGMGLSGAQEKGLQTYGQNTGLTYALQPYLQGVTNISNQGLQAGLASGNWAMQTGQNVSGLQQAGGQATAAGLINAAQAKAMNNDSTDWMSALGMLGSMGMQGMSGGGGGGGGIMSAFGGMFGGGGAGAGMSASSSAGLNNMLGSMGSIM
jgi:hypothetical protein